MIKVTYIEHTGNQISVELNDGESVMEAALKSNLSGIDADCGGSCSCATCHIHVDPIWMSKLPEASSIEKDILTFANDVNEYSRLSCQIKASPSIDGLVVHIPKSEW